MDEDSPLPDLPEGNNDPGDPLNPDIEEENSTPNPPLANPGGDMEVTGENEVDKDDLSDLESDLSEIPEDRFQDFDVEAVAIDDRGAVAIDDSNVAQLGKHKKKRADGDGAGRKEKKERRREKPKKSRRRRRGDDDEEMPDGEEMTGKRRRKRTNGAEQAERRRRPESDEENLTPEERRKRALDRAMDEAIKKPGYRRTKKDGIELDAMADAEIDGMRQRMATAAQQDTDARARGEPAMHKLKLLPEVMNLLNRKSVANSIVDPDINLLEAVRFFLEPLNDGSLPAYNIQRELFAVLGQLPITKDTLVASGIGKVVMFYTRSKRPEPVIKRQAEKLLSDWMRPILKRSDDYRKRDVNQANYDPGNLPIRASQATQKDPATIAREKALATPQVTNRARLEGGIGSYTIAPRSTVMNMGPTVRAPGASGEDAFRKLKARREGKAGRSNRAGAASGEKGRTDKNGADVGDDAEGLDHGND